MISHMRTNIFGNIIRTVHSGIAAGVMNAGGVRLGVDLARAQAGAHELGELDQLGEHALDVQMLRRSWSSARSRRPSAIMNSALARFLVRELVHDLRHGAGAVVEAVAHLGDRDG